MTRGLVLEMSIEDNLILGYHRRPAFARRGLRLASRHPQICRAGAHRVCHQGPQRAGAVQRPLRRQPAEGVVIARVFSETLIAIIVAQPTRGVDVGHGVHSPPPVGSAGRRQVHSAHLRRSGRGAQPVRPSGGHLRRPDRGRGQAGHLERHGDRPADDRRQPLLPEKRREPHEKRALSGLPQAGWPAAVHSLPAYRHCHQRRHHGGVRLQPH